MGQLALNARAGFCSPSEGQDEQSSGISILSRATGRVSADGCAGDEHPCVPGLSSLRAGHASLVPSPRSLSSPGSAGVEAVRDPLPQTNPPTPAFRGRALSLASPSMRCGRCWAESGPSVHWRAKWGLGTSRSNFPASISCSKFPSAASLAGGCYSMGCFVLLYRARKKTPFNSEVSSWKRANPSIYVV